MNTFEFQSAVLRLSYEVGLKTNGEPLYKSKSYRNLKTLQSAAAIALVADAIASLTSYPLAVISKIETDNVITN